MNNKGLSAPPRVSGQGVKINTDIQSLKYIYKQVGTTPFELTPYKCEAVNIQADHDNLGAIYLGTDDNVDTAHSFRRLNAGESYGLGILKTNLIWAVGTDVDDKIRVTVIDK